MRHGKSQRLLQLGTAALAAVGATALSLVLVGAMMEPAHRLEFTQADAIFVMIRSVLFLVVAARLTLMAREPQADDGVLWRVGLLLVVGSVMPEPGALFGELPLPELWLGMRGLGALVAAGLLVMARRPQLLRDE